MSIIPGGIQTVKTVYQLINSQAKPSWPQLATPGNENLFVGAG
jgi:hypothetical protein